MIGALFEDSRGVSPAVTQALTIGISTILVTGLLLGGSQLIDNQQEDISRQGLTDIGSGIASDLVRLDTFETSTLRTDVSFETNYPDRVGDQQYRIRLAPTDPPSGPPYTRIFVNTTGDKDYSTVVRFTNQTNVCSSAATGGTVQVRYNTTPGCMKVAG